MDFSPWTTNTHRNQRRNPSDFLSHSDSSFAVVQQPVKVTSKDLREKTGGKRKKNRVKAWIKCIIVLGLLIFIGVTIFLLVRFLGKSSVTTKPPSSVTLRWRPIGLTLAGLTGSRGLNASQLNRPIDLALTSSNTLYIADFDNNRVQKWLAGASSGVTVAGQADGAAASTAAYLLEPTALYIDANENIYVSDGGNDRVQLWTKGATVGTRVAGTGSPGFAINQLSLPYGVIQDPITKTLYIGDYENHRVMSYASGASTGTVAAGGHGLGFNPTQLNYPVGIDFDSFTNSLFIANFAANNIVRWQLGASSWTLVAGNQTGSSSNTSTMLSLCTGVTLDSLGNVYVADTGNHRIQFFPAGQSEGRTIAGITGVPGTNSTQLTSPYTARLDSQLNLYVADTGGHRIQKFERY